MAENNPQGILFVCLGNICRSPTVEAVARAEFARAGIEVPVESCGTGDWHVGQRADPRAVEAGAAAGYDLSPHRARQLTRADFASHRLVLAMDRSNLRNLRAACPQQLRDRLGLFLEVAGVAPPTEVPDPYNGTAEDFARVVALARRGALGMIRVLQENPNGTR